MLNEKYYPESLKNLPIWALWRIETDQKGRPTKVPYSPHYDGKASSTNPKTWGTFKQAEWKYKSRPGFYNGISLIISKEYGLVFIDIDHCVEEDGSLSETAFDIVRSFSHQFMELSQSGKGVHIIARGTIPRNFKNSNNGVEMYADKRFCSMTGCVFEKADPTEEQSSIDYVFNKYKTAEREIKRIISQNRALQKDDNWIVEHASERGKFKVLFSGDWEGAGYNSQSEADLSLCMILAFWTDCDPDQMDRIFRASGLYREKWDRDYYREMTIGTAISQCSETVSEYSRRMDVERGDSFGKALSQRWDR